MTRAIKQWRVDVMIGENDGNTYAEARLITDIDNRLVGVGRAHVDPHDYDIPEIGDEVAVARALVDLGYQLLSTASDDIEGITGAPTHLRG
jgi:Domain of unknown function (DUF1876)